MGSFMPASLDELRGPAHGNLTLPLELFWGPARTAKLSDLDHVEELYQAVIRIGTAGEQSTYLSKAVLLLVWGALMLPVKTRTDWETAFPELTRAVLPRRARPSEQRAAAPGDSRAR